MCGPQGLINSSIIIMITSIVIIILRTIMMTITIVIITLVIIIILVLTVLVVTTVKLVIFIADNPLECCSRYLWYRSGYHSTTGTGREICGRMLKKSFCAIWDVIVPLVLKYIFSRNCPSDLNGEYGLFNAVPSATHWGTIQDMLSTTRDSLVH